MTPEPRRRSPWGDPDTGNDASGEAHMAVLGSTRVVAGPWEAEEADRLATLVQPGGDVEPQAPRYVFSDLAALARQPRPVPALLGDDAPIYAHGLHQLSGEPGAGKSVWLSGLALAQVRAGKEVLWIDEEAGDEQVVRIFTDLGASPDDLEHVHHLGFPAIQASGGDAGELLKVARDLGPQLSLVAVDSAGAVLAAAALEENSNTDALKLYNGVLLPLARAGRAVIVLDHEVKDSREDSTYAVGAGAKKRAVDAAWKLTTVRAFNRGQSGRIRLSCTKDRLGVFGIGTRREIVVHVDEGRITLLPDDAPIDRADEAPSLPPAYAKMLEALQAAEAPLLSSDLVDLIKARHGHGLKRETASRALNRLAELGLADRLDLGSGVAALWSAVLPVESTRDDHGSDHGSDHGHRDP